MGLMVMEGMSVEISQSLYPSLKSVVCQARFGNVGVPGFQDLETLVMTLSQVLSANLCHMGWIHNVIITSSWGSELRVLSHSVVLPPAVPFMNSGPIFLQLRAQCRLQSHNQAYMLKGVVIHAVCPITSAFDFR